MRQSFASFLSVNRRTVFFLGIVLSLTAFGLAAWQTKAQETAAVGSPAGSQKGTDGVMSDDKNPIESVNTEVYMVELPDKIDRESLPIGPVLLAPTGQAYVAEIEPNNTTATATALGGTNLAARGNVFPNADVDFYSFTATAGDRVYAAVMTSFSANASTDSQLRLFASDGTTLIEFDEDDGSLGSLSSTIANATIPSAGTYFLQVNHFSATNQLRPYELHFRLQSGAPTPETEPNDTPATANPLPANGFVSGARNPAAATEQDWYSMTLNAGDTVYFSLDLDPERDNVQWNGRLGVALFGDANNQILVVDDASVGSATNPLSEAMYMTVKTAGTYFAFVDSATSTVGGPTATYTLSVSVHPAANEGVNCTTYTSTDVPQTIPAAGGLVSSTITVPGNPRIADLDVDIQLNHALMADIDAHLRSPAGNDNGLFTDIGAAATGGQTQMDVTFDDEAAIPPTFTVLRPKGLKPELAYRLGWFDGENAGGTWTLDLRDDTNNASGGTLTGWSLRICEQPPPPACPVGFTPQTVFSTDFESGAAGFTHSGTQDEWELGTPATVATSVSPPVAAFLNCNSGTNCWKTDLDNTYNASSTQDLLSPSINLAGLSAPVVVTWSQRYQMENTTFDRMFVDAQQVGGATPVRLFEWQDATMTNAPGTPVVNIGASAGWATFSRRADSLAGLNTELRFHLDSDTTVQLGGMAVDDVSVTACRGQSADLAITKTDGVTTAIPGGSVTYTITASNSGPDPVPVATVADTFPAPLTCTYTSVTAGGATGNTASGAGNINDTALNFPVGSSVTYTAACNIAPDAFGSLSNTATVSSSVTDPTPGNNSATDTDTLVPTADLSITKTDGVTAVNAGGSTTYTIVASNPGPSNALGSTVNDTFPAEITSANWTCVGAGGGTCTAAGSGNISDIVNLPAGSSVTYTVVANISAAASGTLVNTATVATSGALSIVVVDPNPGNNSATDTDTIIVAGCQGGGNCTTDLSITKTDGVINVNPGQTITYTIVATNLGPTGVNGASVTDTFPVALTGVTWTCVGGGGGTCPANGAGNINALVNLPVNGTATFTATATVAPSATFAFSNTARVTAPTAATDPNQGNNSARDTDAICVPILAGYNAFDRRIVTFAANDPGTYLTDVALVGLNPNEVIKGIDFRPANGLIYGIATTIQVANGNGNTSRVVTIDHLTGAVSSVGSTIAPTSGFNTGVDFNPVPDRIREIDDAENSRRLNPNDGTIAGTDTNLAYLMGDPNEGANPNVVHVAYDRNNVGASLTTLYGIDSDTDSLVRIGGVDGTPSPNTGQLTTVGPLGVDPSSGGGFDILGGTNTAYAALRIFGFSILHGINLTTGAATSIGDIGVPFGPDGKGGPLIDGLTVIAGGCPATAAGVTVSGRVFTPDGYGMRNAIVTITDSTGIARTTRTSSFGYYTFEGIEVGGTYIVSIGSKRYTFAPRTITVNDAVTDLDFTGNGPE